MDLRRKNQVYGKCIDCCLIQKKINTNIHFFAKKIDIQWHRLIRYGTFADYNAQNYFHLTEIWIHVAFDYLNRLPPNVSY